jgi:hypothetical protein
VSADTVVAARGVTLKKRNVLARLAAPSRQNACARIVVVSSSTIGLRYALHASMAAVVSAA